MISDMHKTFSEISNTRVAIRQQVHDIQIHQAVRDVGQRWSDNLRFISVPDTLESEHVHRIEEKAADKAAIGIPPRSACSCRRKPYFPTKGLSELRITTKDPPEIPDCKPYVAISYCWKSQTEDLPQYSIQTVKGLRKNRAPSQILTRAIAFAAYHDISLLWIDQECIDQEDREDHEQGIQSMDLVYQQASHAVALLNVRITSQAYVDALSKMVQGEEFTPGGLRDAVEVLEAIAADRWLSRAWCFQETAAAGESLRLLISCDLKFTGDEGFSYIPGEIEMTVRELQTGVTWIVVCAESLDSSPSTAGRVDNDIQHRAQNVCDILMHICPIAYHTAPRDPTFRFGCNASEALKLLGNRINSRLEDRLAILANICNYSTRLNTYKLNESEKSMGRQHSLSVCVAVLALLNGDMSLLVCSTLQAESLREVQICEKDRIKNMPIPAWMPLGETKVHGLPCLQECYGKEFRLPNPSFHTGNLVISAHLWTVDQRVDLRKIQQQFTSALNSEVDSKSPTPLEYELLWSILRKLWECGLLIAANNLWHRIRRDKILPVPAALSMAINCNTGDLNVPISQLMELEARECQILSQKLLGSGGPYHLSWIRRRAIDKGSLWCGRIDPEPRKNWPRSKSSSEGSGVFDCDGPVKILTPYNEQLQSCSRSSDLNVVSKPMSWIAEETDQFSEYGEGVKCHELVRGVWSSDSQSFQRYIVL